jgi:hypothetical protein
MVGAAIAVLVNCPAELGEHHDNGVVPVVCEKQPRTIPVAEIIAAAVR